MARLETMTLVSWLGPWNNVDNTLQDGHGDACGSFKHDVNVKEAEGNGEDKNKCQERSIISTGTVIGFGTRR